MIESGDAIYISTDESFTSNEEDVSSQQSKKPTNERIKCLILENIADFVQMDPIQTVQLCEQWFESDYESIAMALLEQKALAYSFINTVITIHEPTII